MTAMVGGHEEDEALGAVSVDDSKKSERKRKRERQRRSDLTNALDELAAIVAQIDPDEHSDAAAQKKRRRKSGEAETGSAAAAAAAAAAANDMDSTNMTRLDLVGRTTMVLRRLQRENSELKRRLDDQHLRSAGDDKEVLVMVPTLTIADNQEHPSARAGMGIPSYAQSLPPPPPQPQYYHQHAPHPDPSYAQPPPPPPPPTSIHLGSHYYSSSAAAYHPPPPPPYASLASAAAAVWGNNGSGLQGPPPNHYPPLHYQQPMQDPSRGPHGSNPDDHGGRRDG